MHWEIVVIVQVKHDGDLDQDRISGYGGKVVSFKLGLEGPADFQQMDMQGKAFQVEATA